jgi:hypothetical protein
MAERFFVTEATVASWMKRLDEDGSSALVQTPGPVNRFPRADSSTAPGQACGPSPVLP